VVQKTNNMERKTKSAFKLRSGNKPSVAMFKLFSGPQHSRTRDTFKRIKQKIGDAATYTKAFLGEAFRDAGADNFKYPGARGRDAVRAKQGKSQLKPQPKGKRSTLEAVKKMQEKEKKRKAEIKRKKTPSHSVDTPNPTATTHKFSHKR